LRTDLGVRLRLLFAIDTASYGRGKEHDPTGQLSLSHPAAFIVPDPQFGM
jgi:hypothetical protein